MFSTLLTKDFICFLCLLKIVEIVIIFNIRGEIMKQQVLKALANPARIFYVPYMLAVINFTIQFLIFMVIFVASLILTRGQGVINPLWFLLSVIAVHMILAAFSKRDPQLGQIVAAKIQLMKKKIPNKLVA